MATKETVREAYGCQRNTLIAVFKGSKNPEKKAVVEALEKATKDKENVGVVIRGGVGFESEPE